MSATMTQPADLWTDAAQDETAFENRMAEADARDEFEHNEAVKETASDAADACRALLAAQNWKLLIKTMDAYRGTLELMTGETWPAHLPEFLTRCDETAKGDAGMTERELMEWVA